jgi:hypothetical protein
MIGADAIQIGLSCGDLDRADELSRRRDKLLTLKQKGWVPRLALNA